VANPRLRVAPRWRVLYAGAVAVVLIYLLSRDMRLLRSTFVYDGQVCEKARWFTLFVVGKGAHKGWVTPRRRHGRVDDTRPTGKGQDVCSVLIKGAGVEP